MTAVSPMVLVLLGVAVVVAIVLVLGGLGRLDLSMEPPHRSLWAVFRARRAARVGGTPRTEPTDAAQEASDVTDVQEGDRTAVPEEPSAPTSEDRPTPERTVDEASEGRSAGPGSGTSQGSDRPSRDEV